MGCCDWLEFFRDWRHARIYLPKAITSVSLLVFMIFMNFSSGMNIQIGLLLILSYTTCSPGLQDIIFGNDLPTHSHEI